MAYNPDTMTVTLNPSNNLLSRTIYTARVTAGAQDATGNALPVGKTWSFKVR